MSSKEIELELKSAILDTGVLTPVDISVKGKTAWVMCRQVKGSDKFVLDFIPGILQLESGLLELSVCKKYVLKENALVFGWYFRFEGSNAENLKEGIVRFSAFTKTLVYKPEADNGPQTGRGNGSTDTSKAERNEPSPRNNTPTRNSAPSIQTVKRFDKETGQVVDEVVEMPLPHVGAMDMNAPTGPNGKGAKVYGGN